MKDNSGFNITGKVDCLDFTQAFIETTYGVARFEASPFLINIIKFGALIAVNDIVLSKGVPVPSNITNFMDIKDLFLGYYDDYIALGLTPKFNKVKKPVKPTNNTNGTVVDPPTPAPKNVTTKQTLVERIASKLYDIHQSVYGEESQDYETGIPDDSGFFKHFDAQRLSMSCEPGKCGYISDVIDQMEREML